MRRGPSEGGLCTGQSKATLCVQVSFEVADRNRIACHRMEKRAKSAVEHVTIAGDVRSERLCARLIGGPAAGKHGDEAGWGQGVSGQTCSGLIKSPAAEM